MSLQEILIQFDPYIWLLGAIIAGALLGYILHAIIWRIIRSYTRKSETNLDDALQRKWKSPSRGLIITLLMYVSLHSVAVNLTPQINTLIADFYPILLIIVATWTLIKLTDSIEDVVLHHYRTDVRDNLRAREVHTQARIIKRLIVTALIICGVAAVLMSFEEFRQIGVGLFASAGVAGLVLGLAAQKTLGNLLAGIQIAITQPIRLDDVVVVEGEWGRIEEITLTYVVVKIWDSRRLVLPISYFIERPFQNWTRTSAEILGYVYIYCDYDAPVGEIRAELEKIVARSDDWNKDVVNLQVTDSTERSLQLRALMSADDSGAAWNLRCFVREELISYLQKTHPTILPRVRIEMEGG